MANLAERIAAEASGPAAIPRRNGDPVFNEPWESRVFGMAVGLCERGFYDWDEFRERLIAEISSADARHEDSTYYERFLRVLQRLIVEKRICDGAEISQRVAEYLFEQGWATLSWSGGKKRFPLLSIVWIVIPTIFGHTFFWPLTILNSATTPPEVLRLNSQFSLKILPTKQITDERIVTDLRKAGLK